MPVLLVLSSSLKAPNNGIAGLGSAHGMGLNDSWHALVNKGQDLSSRYCRDDGLKHDFSNGMALTDVQIMRDPVPAYLQMY